MKERGGARVSSLTIRVFIADGHGLFRGALRALIDDQLDMRVVGEAVAGIDAGGAIQSAGPDVAVLDIDTAEANGVAPLAALTRAFPALRMIAITEDGASVGAALAAGAVGYVVKSASVCELLAAIRAVSRGRIFVDAPFEPTALPGWADGSAGPPRRLPDEISPLTRREREVMIRVAEGYTNNQIAQELCLSVKSIETYRARLMDKLGLTSRADLVRFALDCGALAAGKPVS